MPRRARLVDRQARRAPRRRAAGLGTLLILLILVAAASRAAAHDPNAVGDKDRAPATSDERAAGYGELDFPVPAPGTYELPPLGAAADGAVLDGDGHRTRLADLLGDKLVVLSFIYTSCPDATGCPLATHVLAGAAARIARDPKLAGRVRFLSLSFDAARDTPEVMRRYGASLADEKSDWRFLAAPSAAEIAPLLAAYGQTVNADVDARGKPLGTISHVLRVFLIDRDKRIRNIYSASFLHTDLLVGDLETLEIEATASEAAGKSPAQSGEVTALLELARHPPLGLPPVPVPADNPLTPAKVALGRKLFFDRRLSHNDTFSCAMCHVPEQGFAMNEMATAVGIEGRTVKRNAPTLLNVAYAPRLFHDAREQRLELQIWSPLLASNEMGNPSIGYVLEKLGGLDDYRGLFEAAFDGHAVSVENVGMALASYERTLIAGDSAFDRWHFGKDEKAVTEDAKHGYSLFTGRAGCVSCHVIESDHALLTDYGLYQTGIGYRAMLRRAPPTRRIELPTGQALDVESDAVADASEIPPTDLGRYEVTERPEDRWRYRTPSLRNVALTAPYMHDGSIATLDDVVAYYDGGGEPSELLDPRIRPLGLTPDERRDLVAFLESLTASNVGALVAEARAEPVGDRR